MKRTPYFYLVLFISKLVRFMLLKLGRNATNFPGELAIWLCRSFIGRMPKPKKVICITGTNGKTTVANLIEDVLEKTGADFYCNRNGSNVYSGVASLLLANSDWRGRPTKELAVFELDERSSNLILPYMRPDLMLCTNIFRDSYQRNAPPDFICDFLKKYHPDGLPMILNADDMMCSGLKPDNPRVYFSIAKQPGDGEGSRNIVQDVPACPRCGGELQWDFRRYHHIGGAVCKECGFSSPKADYTVTELRETDMVVDIRGESYTFPLANNSYINVYNSLAAIALLCEHGIEPGTIAQALGSIGISATRYMEEEVNGRKAILHLAKGQNPVACSRAFQNIRDYPGRKAAILFLDDFFDAQHTVENISWLYDADFEFLSDDSVVQLIVAGARHWDVYLRLLLAGVPAERIDHMPETSGAADALRAAEPDAVFILYDVYTIRLAEDTEKLVKEKLKKEAAKNAD